MHGGLLGDVMQQSKPRRIELYAMQLASLY